MAPKNAILWTNHPEYTELMNFLIERTKDANTPLNITRLVSEFREKSKSSLSEKFLWNRIQTFRSIVHGMDDIDVDTKVKLLFGLRTPINDYFLEYLQTRAEVVLDNRQRIVKYRKNGGGLELGETPKKPPKKRSNWESDPEYVDLFNFLIEKTNDAVSPLCLKQLAEEFNEKSGAAQTMSGLQSRIQRLRPRIHGMIHIDMDAKIKLLFSLSVPISSYFLEYLKNRAEVILDGNNRIIRYRKYGGGLELEGIHAIIYNKNETIQRDERMMDFLARNAINLNSPITDISFVKEFKKTTGTTKHLSHLTRRYNLLKNNIHESTDYDERTKLRMMFVSGASVPNDFLEILRKDVLVEVDDCNRITKYRANDGSLELHGDHSRSAKNRAGKIESERCYPKLITDYYKNRGAENDEMGNLIEFITEKCKSVGLPMSSRQLAKEFSNLSGISTEFPRAYIRIRGYCREIQKLDVLDTPTKVRQLFGLGGVLNDDFLEKLRKEAAVEVDHRNRIINYSANDGSLTLKGSHRRSRKAEEEDMVTADGPDEESDREGLNDDNDGYSSDSEGYLSESGDYVEPSKVDNLNYESDERKSRTSTGTDIQKRTSKNSEKSKTVATRSGRVSKKRTVDTITSPQKRDSSKKKTSKKSKISLKRIQNSETDQLEDYVPSFDNFQVPEVKLEPFRGSLIDGYVPMNPDNDIEVIPAPVLREPKKEIVEEPIRIEMMEFSTKTEEYDLIIPKQEKLEEEDIKPELFY